VIDPDVLAPTHDDGESAAPDAATAATAGRRRWSGRAWWERIGATGMRPFWVFAAAVLAAQLVVLAAYSAFLYHRDDLLEDFAHNAQAWFLIGHGHLNPVDTVRLPATPFLKDHFDLVMWPLSLLRFVWPQTIDLLWVQDVAIVATGLVAAFWIAGVCRERLTRGRNLAAAAALVVLVINPWWYETASFDVHIPPLGLPICVFVGYSLWRGRFRRAAIAALFTVLFGSTVVELVLFVALAGLLSGRVRRAGGTVTSVGIAGGALVVMAVVSALHANQASNLIPEFGYLAGSAHPSIRTILSGAIVHPHAWIAVLHSRWRQIGRLLSTTGFLGLLSPWGLMVTLGTVVPAGAAHDPAYISWRAGFQTLQVVPFMVVGTVMVLVRIAAGRALPAGAGPAPSAGASPGGPPPASELSAGLDAEAAVAPTGDTPVPAATGIVVNSSVPEPAPDASSVATAPPPVLPPAPAPAGGGHPWVAVVLAVALGIVAVVEGQGLLRQLGSDWWRDPAPSATILRHTDTTIPAGGEVIVSSGVMGRFADHTTVLQLADSPQRFTVAAPTVTFVIVPEHGLQALPAPAATADVAYVRDVLRATPVVEGHGVYVYRWTPPQGTTSVTLP
jgi:hypothetical protein